MSNFKTYPLISFFISSFATPALLHVITGVPAAQDSFATTPHASLSVGNKKSLADAYSFLSCDG